jgi:ABC-type lipoprotein release transport system permease subunit
MRISVSTKYALNSLRRHVRRTILSVIGIGLGCGLCLLMIGWVKGESKMMLKAAAESGNGHLRIAPAEWVQTRQNDLRLDNWRSILQELRLNEKIKRVTPHARKEGLLAFGTRTIGVEVVGVDPTVEQAMNRLVRNLDEGHYLVEGSSGTVVVGREIAQRLKVELDDELLITVADSNGQMSSAMLRIVGIAETGSEELDASICHITISDMVKLTALIGAAELTAVVEEPRKLERTAKTLSAALPRNCTVLTWKEIMPELASGVKVDETWTRLTVGIVMIVVLLGIASAQLTAVLERRREFAVLSALGMRKMRLIKIMLVEGLVLGIIGGTVGLGFGIPFTYLLATRGIDFSRFYGSSGISVSNILIDSVFQGDFGWWLFPLAFVLSLTATILSSLYPAWYASRTDPAVALRVEH